MAGFDELLYYMAPFMGTAGNGLINNMQGKRTADAMKGISTAKTLADFPAMDNVYDPNMLQHLMTQKDKRQGEIQANEAAPVAAEAARLNRMATIDPYIGSAEGRADFAKRPGFWLGAPETGVVSGTKKTVNTETGYNPRIAEAVQGFGNNNTNILNAFRTMQGDPMAASTLSTNKDLSGGFKDVATSLDQFSTIKKRDADIGKEGKEAANLQDFLASSSMLTVPMERTGKMMPYGEAAQLVQQAAADYPVKPELLNNTIDNLLQQYDKTQIPVSGTTGRTKWTGTQNLLGNVSKDVQSVAPVTNVYNNNPVAQTQFVEPSTGKPLVFDKKTGTYRVANVEGGVTAKPAAFTPEAAAKAQLVEQGLTYIPRIREGLVDANGNIDRVNVANIGARTPFTKGRELSTLILDAVEAKLRAESGAAVPEPEVKRAAKRFVPQVGDNDKTIRMKIDNLEKFLKGTADKINRGRQPQGATGGFDLDLNAIDAAIARKKRGGR